MSKFMQVEVITFKNQQAVQKAVEAGEDISQYQTIFPMTVRKEFIAAVNVLTDPPSPAAKSVVYFTAESALKMTLSTEDPSDIIDRAEN